MKRNVFFAAALALACFVGGYLAGRQGGPRGRPEATAASFDDEMEDLTVHFARRRDAEHAKDDPAADRAVLKERRQAVRELYRRHGRPAPSWLPEAE